MKRVNFAFGRLNSLMNKQMRQYDVCVIGGGPGGIAAALSAARGGAKVLLVEKNGCMGGNLVSDDTNAYIFFVGQSQMFFRGDIA